MIKQNAGHKLIFMPDFIHAIGPKAANIPWYLAAGVNPIAAYQAKGVADYPTSLINLFTPGTYDLTENNGAVTWSAVRGWQFTGAAAAKSLNTGLQAAATWSVFLQFAGGTIAAGTYLCFGATTAVPVARFFFGHKYTATQVIYANGGFTTPVPILAAGNLGIAGNVPYRNGVQDGAVIGAGNQPILNSFIGAINNAGAAGSFTIADIYAVIIYNVTLTPAQASLIVTAMAAL